ncbi:unnamed protein product [Ambrosiozyma monospora]|uniref:Unnamed protein product n=1 Tax=Ambrosiozyma monospora TaxID=43982 RepID=A0ACB5T8Q4_AMBMO|nr:unnamed protein product [Ambrosiozyma monospora]
MRSLSLHSYKNVPYDYYGRDEQADLCFPDELELDKLTNLRDASFTFPTVSGQFPHTLESLRVDLSNYFEPFHDFWKAFVSPLENLLSFSALIRDDQDIDFKGLSFPKHLHTIELLGENNNNMRLLFEQVPESLIHFGYNFHRFRSTEPVKVIIEKHNDELSLESVEKVFGGQAVYEFEWLGDSERSLIQDIIELKVKDTGLVSS